MFVKVVTSYNETTYECSSVQFMNGEGHESKRLLVNLTDAAIETLEVFKNDSAIYIMNDNGRTIDHYVWEEHAPPNGVPIPNAIAG